MGNAQSVKSHVENAERTGVFQLSKAGITEFPKDIARLKATCRSLDLSLNKIKAVPDGLGTFLQMKQLNLSGNKIASLPESLGALKKLETLTLNGNQLSSIPLSFEGLTALRNLNLCDNKITSFPMVLAKLKHLDVLDLSKNKITEVPNGLESLQVSELNLNQNQISGLSESLASCPRLKVLRVEENCLQLQLIPPNVLKNSQIALFAIDGNLFEMKDFQGIDGYDQYMERYTSTKKKIF